jgi:hypothetical protein
MSGFKGTDSSVGQLPTAPPKSFLFKVQGRERRKPSNKIKNRKKAHLSLTPRGSGVWRSFFRGILHCKID